MERIVPSWGKDNIWRFLAYTAIIFFYEFIGTFFLVAVINATGGSAIAIGLSLFFLLVLGGPITGAHYNPAITIGVLINRSMLDGEKQNSTLVELV